MVMSTQALCAELNRSWAAFSSSVKPGDKVIVTRMNSGEYAGSIVAVDERNVRLRVAAGEVVVDRTDVLNVRTISRRGRHALIGALVGVGVGAVTLWGVDSRSYIPHTTEAVVLGGVLGGGAGAVTGALLPGGTKRLYEAERTATTTGR